MSSIAPVGAEVSGCPRETGILLIGSPRDRVAAAFADFRSPLFEDGPGERGGEWVNRHTRLTAESDRNADYHVESSFTEEQRGYVGATMAALNMLFRGEVVVGGRRRISSFSERVITSFLAQDPKEFNFQRALVTSTLDLLSDFVNLYPNLMPAFNAVIEVAGVAGMATALNHARRLLPVAVRGRLDSDLKNLGPLSVKLVSRHRGIYSEEIYEVWCSGEAAAKTLYRQAKLAALHLASLQEVSGTYSPIIDSSTDGLLDLNDRAILREALSRLVPG